MRPGKFAPFIHTSVTTPYIGIKYLIALLPCVIYAVLSYGLRAFALISFSAALSMMFELLITSVTNKGKKSAHYFDYSSISSGIVFALLLPPDCSLLIAAFGIMASVLLFKYMFGGLGKNVYLVPVAGRLLVEALFPSQLDTFAVPGTKLLEYKSLFFNSNTNASIFQLGSDVSEYSFIELLAGRYPSFIGTGCFIMILIGFIYLCLSKTIKVRLPLTFLFSTFVASIIAFWNEGILLVCALMIVSGAMFVAAFLLSDYTTSSNSFNGSIIAGAISGIVFVICYKFSGAILAICASVIISNLVSFIFDYFDLGSNDVQEEVED